MKFGYQLSSIAPYLQTESDLRAALEKIAGIGFEWVQLQGAAYSIPDLSIQKAMEDTGLRCIALQEDFPLDFDGEPDRAIRRAAACGCRYLTFAAWPGRFDSIEDIQRFAEKASHVCDKAASEGIILSFHPIGPDFKLLDGVPVYEKLLSFLPEKAQLTFCVSSCFGTGTDPYEVLKKYSGRVDLVHFKERKSLPDGRTQLAPLGEGGTDWPSIASACRQAGVKYVFAEQEQWDRDAFECAAVSFRYLMNIDP